MATPQPTKKHKKGFFRRIKLKSIVNTGEKLAGSIVKSAPVVGNAASEALSLIRRAKGLSSHGVPAPAAIQAAVAEQEAKDTFKKIPTILWIGLGVTVLWFALRKKG